MTGIKDDADQGGIGMSEEGCDFAGGFDDASTMMMEGTNQPTTLIDCLDDLRGNRTGVGEDNFATRGIDTPGVGGAIGVTAVVVSQNNEWLMRLPEDLGGMCEEFGGALGVIRSGGNLGYCAL
jgi:hypothetical protein